MDVLVLIDKLDDLVHNAKAVPLTDQVRIDREEIYDILDQMRATIPEEIKQARWIVKERQEMLAEAVRVIRGNLLVIPINQSFLYIEPVFLLAAETNIPQLKRVIVSNGEHVAMEATLAKALQGVWANNHRLRKKHWKPRKHPHPGHAKRFRMPSKHSAEATGPHSGGHGSN